MKMLSDYPAYDDCYHFVASTKYRKDLFISEEMRTRLKNIITDIVSKTGAELLACTVAYNHMHVLVKSELPAEKMGNSIFGASSRSMRSEYPELKNQIESGLWGGTSCEAIRDGNHLTNAILYINRHLPDNTKINM